MMLKFCLTFSSQKTLDPNETIFKECLFYISQENIKLKDSVNGLIFTIMCREFFKNYFLFIIWRFYSLEC